MNPFTVMLGITLGSLVSIAFSLGGVLFVFWFLSDESPRFDTEMPELLRSTAIFFCLAAIAAAGFIGTLKKKRWRHVCLSLLWVGLVSTGWYYWPS
ncbi:MAG: hypothetical protein QGF90_07895 [Gammaproteobacteria bacterium]|nr:hypothetical protein [Gammaproteobacteria bacterium]